MPALQVRTGFDNWSFLDRMQLLWWRFVGTVDCTRVFYPPSNPHLLESWICCPFWSYLIIIQSKAVYFPLFYIILRTILFCLLQKMQGAFKWYRPKSCIIYGKIYGKCEWSHWIHRVKTGQEPRPTPQWPMKDLFKMHENPVCSWLKWAASEISEWAPYGIIKGQTFLFSSIDIVHAWNWAKGHSFDKLEIVGHVQRM